jgi:hypothetical protein
MASKLLYKLAPVMQRWGNNAPAVCCGVCKPCVTQAATGAIVAATGLSLEGLALRRSGASGSGESGSGEDAYAEGDEPARQQA